GPRRIPLRRREFLAASAAAAGAALLPALPGEAATPVTRSWVVPPNRYLLRFDGYAFACDCLPQAGAGEPRALTPDAALVRLGPRLEPVAWDIAAWHQLDPFT